MIYFSSVRNFTYRLTNLQNYDHISKDAKGPKNVPEKKLILARLALISACPLASSQSLSISSSSSSWLLIPTFVAFRQFCSPLFVESAFAFFGLALADENEQDRFFFFEVIRSLIMARGELRVHYTCQLGMLLMSRASIIRTTPTTSIKNELIFYLRISRYPTVVYFVYLCQSY